MRTRAGSSPARRALDARFYDGEFDADPSIYTRMSMDLDAAEAVAAFDAYQRRRRWVAVGVTVVGFIVWAIYKIAEQQ